MLVKINTNKEIYNNIKNIKKDKLIINTERLVLANLVFKDMMKYLQIWRQVRGYSKNNQRSHSNNKGNKKKKLINKYRLQQFYQLFGRKKRDIFSVLILAEYNNRLWYICWKMEWCLGRIFMNKLGESHKKGLVKFDPHMLSKNMITGIIKERKKKKHNVAKRKIVYSATIGVPVFFSLFLYKYTKKHVLKYELSIADEVRKKMGKKKKKKKK